MMESEAEENIEMDEFEAFKFRACSPRLACKQLERLDSEEEYGTSRSSLPTYVSSKHTVGNNGRRCGDTLSPLITRFFKQNLLSASRPRGHKCMVSI